MEKLKLILFSIVVLSLLALALYWSVNTIQSGTEYVASQKVKQLEKENENYKKEIKRLGAELAILQAREEVAAPIVEKNPEAPVATMYKHQTLINELQKLIDENILMKLKSNGTRVGTVQKFLNIYNNTSNRVDNDYGAGTVSAVKAFQKDAGLTADGESGASTFSKMIDWLKKQK